MTHLGDGQNTIPSGTLARPARILKYDTVRTHRYCGACERDTEHLVTTVHTITGRAPRDIIRCLDSDCPDSIEHT